MRAKFAFLVAAMALGIAALAPAANADTVQLLNVSGEPLGNGAQVVGIAADLTGEFPEGGKIYCEELEWFAEATETESDPIELKQYEDEYHHSQLRGCYKSYGPWNEPWYQMNWTQFEMDPVYLSSDGTGELNFGLYYENIFKNGPGCYLRSWEADGPLDVSFTSSDPAELNVKGAIGSGLYPCLSPIVLQFNLKLYDEHGRLAIDIS